MPDPTFDEALASLQASLPENPDIDTAPQRALRVVVTGLRPWPSEPVDWDPTFVRFAETGDPQALADLIEERTGAKAKTFVVVQGSSAEDIVRELATECGPPLDPEWGDCPWCEEPGVERSSDDPSTHTVVCTWRKACEWVAAHPSPAPDTEGAAQPNAMDGFGPSYPGAAQPEDTQ